MIFSVKRDPRFYVAPSRRSNIPRRSETSLSYVPQSGRSARCGLSRVISSGTNGELRTGNGFCTAYKSLVSFGISISRFLISILKMQLDLKSRRNIPHDYARDRHLPRDIYKFLIRTSRHRRENAIMPLIFPFRFHFA